MSASEDSWTEKLAGLRADYARDLPDKLAEIQAGWRTHLESPTAATHGDLVRRVHNLAGTGATFGLPAISECARALERFLHDVVGTDPARAAGHDAGFQDHFGRLVEAGQRRV